MTASAFDERFSTVLPITVAWGEMDAYGHVNNAVFFRYFESARMAFLTRIGFVDPNDNGGTGPILASTQCVFRRPLRFPDTIRVGTRVTHMTADRFTMSYEIWSDTQSEIVARGEGVVVAYHYANGAKSVIPVSVADRIAVLAPGLQRA
jgi:acyl-CoA thioester hydrolase